MHAPEKGFSVSPVRSSSFARKLALAFLLSLGGPGSAALAPGMRAPDFTGRTTGGQAVQLSKLRGQVVVVDFWGPG